MGRHLKRSLGKTVVGLAAVALATLPLAARAQDAPAGTPQQSPVVGWDEFIESLRDLPDRMLAKLPEEMRQDPQIRAEIGRIALEALASSSIETLGADPQAPVFLPAIGQVLDVGQPNADTVYKSASVDPTQVYRISGKAGTIPIAVIAQVFPGSNARPHLDLSTPATDKEGRFSVLLGSERPKGYTGDFWKLEPDTHRLMMRFVSADWSHEVQPVVTIQRVSGAMGRPRPSAQDLTARLRALPRAFGYLAPMFVDRVEKLAVEGYVNRFKAMVPAEGALASQFYYDGVFDLKDDEALIVESDVPETCEYRSLILTNRLYETIDWTNNHSSLNAAQAAPDSDGKLRIVVSAKDPGVKNWLDTAGYSRGMIQGRWTGCSSQPIPSTTKVKVKDVLKSLPADVAKVTPEQRDAIVRERNRAYQERALW
ncbi:DUF1214 domain-containing protein [Novosphingobium mangrovi (ex Huang et al. 2023)]|uniref:DUF1214 domain-containing protein n=1 Tax=Novosphingobium mangrovi (ex Huang et al. 2023) TaxID=2976432 RepID=A0ABT2IA92_9SPHN|nr:DUF1214 domain-containing protein [Novosphingobium mangrovi (ex Huang et al. 2023)]MCT2401689.1 hypothetical protein [Novosphingobium mangrovi (ex Huang et al. 2023)]